MAPFKVIIVGGSVTGLTLANILERYNIDYVLLEKGPVIAPQLGAGFAILPNGARILDQLGCYEMLSRNNEPVNSIESLDQYGTLRERQPEIGRWMQECFGYKMRFMDRQHVVQGIFDNLQDKSKVHTNCRVVHINCDSDGVAVETNDGSVHYGDIVVGADGIHSVVRQEMQSLAAESIPAEDLFPEKDSFQCSYGGFFGTSTAPKGVIQDQAIRSFRERRSYLCAGGPNNTVYWILLFKNDRETQGKSIPRYTQEDQERLLAMCRKDTIKPGFTFGDLYESRIDAAIVPLEEGVLKTCFYRRLILVGDSWHKINPLSGLGGNNAMMSAASLADELKDLIESGDAVSERSLQDAFYKYQNTRESSTWRLMKIAHLSQRLDALETPLLKCIQLQVVCKMSIETMINLFGQIFAPAVRLKYLPVQPQPHLLPFNDELKIDFKEKTVLTRGLWVPVFVLMILIYLLLPQFDNSIGSSSTNLRESVGVFNRTQLHFHMSVAVIVAIMCLESYRQFFFMKILTSVLPFSLASIFLGWEVLTPIYFMFFVYLTGSETFYYPSARALDYPMVTSIQWAWLATYLPVSVYTLWRPTFPIGWWTTAHATLPLMVQFFRKWTAHCSRDSLSSPSLLYGRKDIPFILRFMESLHVAQYLELAVTQCNVWKGGYDIYRLGFRIAVTRDFPRAMLVDSAIMLFCLFTYCELRRVGICRSRLWHHITTGLCVSVAFSPATTLALLWGLREAQWSEAREEKDTVNEISSESPKTTSRLCR